METNSSKLFTLGLVSVITMMLIVLVLQILSTQQRDKLIKQKEEIVHTLQYKAELESKFASLTRGDVLQPISNSIYPNFETMNFAKIISIDQIPIKQNIVTTATETIENTEKDSNTNE